MMLRWIMLCVRTLIMSVATIAIKENITERSEAVPRLTKNPTL